MKVSALEFSRGLEKNHDVGVIPVIGYLSLDQRHWIIFVCNTIYLSGYPTHKKNLAHHHQSLRTLQSHCLLCQQHHEDFHSSQKGHSRKALCPVVSESVATTSSENRKQLHENEVRRVDIKVTGFECA